MSSKSYWEKREAEALESRIKDEKEYDKQLAKIYRNMLDACQNEINAFFGRYAAKEGISIAEAKKRVSKADIAAYERKAKRYVKEKDFSKEANEEMRLYNLMMKVNRLEMLKANIGLELIAGHDELQKFMQGILQGRTEDELKRQAGILGKTIQNNAKAAHAIVNASFHNATFSDRIWMYQNVMKADLSQLLQSGLIQGKNPRVLARELEKKFGVSKSNAERLMRTELARVQMEAQKQSYIRNGFKMYTFHTNTGCCDICAALNGKHFNVADMMPGENANPMHPNCRCSTSAYEDSDDYEAWLDYLDKGGTTEEWNEKRANSAKKDIAKRSNSDIIKASKLPERFRSHLPNEERRLQIIEEGIKLERPIFDNGSLGKYAETLRKQEGYYDVVLHGSAYGLEYFGEKIDVETLCAIIAQRKDYKKGTKIRLVSCHTGSEEDGVAQYIADKLHVEVLAPEKYAVLQKTTKGDTITYSGEHNGKKDGEFKPFTPNSEVS